MFNSNITFEFIERGEAVELYQLKSFLEIIETQNLTRAANNMHISQSALSSQIRLLEDELGLKLFARTARGMVLTEYGRILHSYAGEVLGTAEMFLSKAREMSGRKCGTCKIGLNTDGGFLKVGRLSRALTAAFPHINFVFVSSQTIRTPEMLRQGLIDIGFFFGDFLAVDIVSEVISHFVIRVVIPETILPSGSEISWPVVAGLPWIWSVCDCPYYQIVRVKMDELGLEPLILVDAMDESVVKELVLDGQGLAILREDEARDVAQQGKVAIWEDVSFTLPLRLGILKSSRANPMLESVAAIIRAAWSPASSE
ncbi:MAG: LysR family transcriptional regulator [Desulfoprunum sp.]|nr:LysR family transcriptional regulator [Desulfoprunum sp.]